MQQEPKQDYSNEAWEREAIPFSWSYLGPKNWAIWLVLLITFLIGRLPWNWVISIGRGIGKLLYKMGGERLNVARKNIEVCFPELPVDEQEHLVKQSFEHMGIAVLSPSLFWFSRASRVCRHSKLIGWENAQQHLDQGQGVLVNGIHNVHIEAGARIFYDNKVSGLPEGQPDLKLLYRPLNQEAVEYFSMTLRARYSSWSSWLPRKKVKALLCSLQQGRAAGILQDQDFGKKNSIYVPFFGVNAATVPSASSFAWQGNAKLVPMEHYLDEETNEFHVVFHPALDNFPTEDPEADMVRINQIAEEQIRRHPGQYLWSHRRFKNRPEGEPMIYPKRKRGKRKKK